GRGVFCLLVRLLLRSPGLLGLHFRIVLCTKGASRLILGSVVLPPGEPREEGGDAEADDKPGDDPALGLGTLLRLFDLLTCALDLDVLLLPPGHDRGGEEIDLQGRKLARVRLGPFAGGGETGAGEEEVGVAVELIPLAGRLGQPAASAEPRTVRIDPL